MNGPQHYREAERLLADAKARREKDKYDVFADVLVAEAQAHATLALAAATAAEQATAYDGDEDHSRTRGWAGVA